MLRLTTRRRAVPAAATCRWKHTVAIVGAGPAGLYTGLRLRKEMSPPPDIHYFESLPVPFGLIRYGVAPDHPEVKVHSSSVRLSNINSQYIYLVTTETLSR